MKLRLATWNINSARLRMPQILRFLKEYDVDVLCLQEIKCTNEQFPLEELAELGYANVALNGQKAYHGVATLARIPMRTVTSTVYGGIEEARHINIELPEIKRAGVPVQIHNFYVPAGGDVPDVSVNPKFQHKLDFLSDMASSFKKQKAKNSPMILVGDLNVAPLENDVWSHKQMLKVISHTPIEVEHLDKVVGSLSWIDAMRCHVPDEDKLYTWWSYRAKDWKASNRGRRLDHVWMTPALDGCARDMQVVEPARSWERPSDHAPVIVDLQIKP
jgi:exodeoxyribonuclease III